MEKSFSIFPHNGKQPSAEPEPQAMGEREVYSATQRVASEYAQRTQRQNVSTLWKTPSAPVLMGILNLTPDSFSDGGKYIDPAAAEEQALRLEAEGAHLLDVGAESTRPGHETVSEAEELRRLLPVLDRLAGKLRIPVSIDTSKAAVARAAFDHGAAILNDVAALSRPGMLEFARGGSFPIVLMHGVAHVLAEDDPAPSDTIATWFVSRMAELGINKSRIILDPGIGFGTTRPQDAAILDNLAPLLSLGYPLLIGLSRKRIVRTLHPEQDRDLASAQMALKAWKNGATILRLHELRPIRALLTP